MVHKPVIQHTHSDCTYRASSSLAPHKTADLDVLAGYPQRDEMDLYRKCNDLQTNLLRLTPLRQSIAVASRDQNIPVYKLDFG
jgi:hypothetical protein